MIRSFFLMVMFVVGISSVPAMADFDPVLEAQEEAARAAQKAEAQRRRAEAAAAREAAENDANRKFLGKDAEGKTDAEVRALVKARVEKDQASAKAKQAEAFGLLAEAQSKNSAADQLMKQHVGKSFNELQNMSPEELEAFAAQMEKTHLQGLEGQ